MLYSSQEALTSLTAPVDADTMGSLGCPTGADAIPLYSGLSLRRATGAALPSGCLAVWLSGCLTYGALRAPMLCAPMGALRAPISSKMAKTTSDMPRLDYQFNIIQD